MALKPRQVTCWNCGHVHRATRCHVCKQPAKPPRKGPRPLRRSRWEAIDRLRRYLKNPAARNPVKPSQAFGTSATVAEFERVQELLEDGYTVMLTPLADQVVIAVVDLDKLMRLIGDPRSSLH